MDSRAEIERITLTNNLSSMPANPWEFDVALGGRPDESLRGVLEVLGEIARHAPSDWPSDAAWQNLLPQWLKAQLLELSREETDALLAKTPRDQWASLPWDRGSWLDAIRDRGWRWWGYRRDGALATFVLHVAMFPERIDAFRELLRAAGVTIRAERYAALSRE
jgi:hypothetical protein